MTKQIDMVKNSQRHGKFFPAIPDNHFSSIQSKKVLPSRQISRWPHGDCSARAGSKAIGRSHILRNLTVASKLKLQLTHMQLSTSHYGTWRVMLQTPFRGKLFMNWTECRTIRTNIRAGIRSNGKEWQINQVFSFRKRILCSIKPTC